MPDLAGTRRLLSAVAFAARAHAGQLRKDGITPYVSHPARVCLILSHVFGVTDIDVLAAAVLHDTVEDTKTDFDELGEQFGGEIAAWVGVLTKDKRLPEDRREADYADGLRQASWQVQVCKLADIYDNLMDAESLTEGQRKKGQARARYYLDKIKMDLDDRARRAWEVVDALYRDCVSAQPG